MIITSQWRPIRAQTVAVGASSVSTTNAVGGGIRAVRLVSDTDCHYAVDKSPTATTGGPLLPANVVEHISIHEGERVAFIQNAAGGTAYVTELSA